MPCFNFYKGKFMYEAQVCKEPFQVIGSKEISIDRLVESEEYFSELLERKKACLEATRKFNDSLNSRKREFHCLGRYFDFNYFDYDEYRDERGLENQIDSMEKALLVIRFFKTYEVENGEDVIFSIKNVGIMSLVDFLTLSEKNLLKTIDRIRENGKSVYSEEIISLANLVREKRFGKKPS